MTSRVLPFLLSMPLSAPLFDGQAHAMPNDNPRESIGDGEVIVINDCRPGHVAWNIDGVVHCVNPVGLPPPAPPPQQGDPDRGIGGDCGRAPSSGPVAACGGGTRRPNRREKCIAKAEKWENTCVAQTIAFHKECRSTAYDQAIGLCTGQGASAADNTEPRRPCYGPVVDRYYNATDHRFEDEVRLNDMGKPVYWDPVHNVACDDRRGCAGSWLYERPEATVSGGSSSSWGVNGGVQVGVPGFSAEVGGNEGGGESMTVEIKFDPRLGGYMTCVNGTQAWRDTCSAKSGEMKAKCPR
jgi:hypothetical protein